MRILLVTPYFIPAWGFGGPVKVVADLATELHHRGHHVTVATTDVLDAKKRIHISDDVLDGVPVKYFRNISTTAAFRWNVYAPRGFASWLKKNIQQFDVIHCHDFYTGLNVAVSRVASKAGVPYVIQPHGALIPIRQQAKFSWIKKLWLRMYPEVFGQASQVLASTIKEQQEIHQWQNVPIDRITVLPNGLDAASVGRPAARNDVRRQFGLSAKDFVVLYFGRIQYIKGVDISLQALAEIQDVPWKYIVVGRDDGQQEMLKTLSVTLGIADRVQFVGPKFGNELNQLLGISDVFLFNSRSESFPIAVLNACAAGLPAILSPECRLPEVEAVGAGVILSANTPSETARILRQLLPDMARRKMMSQAGPRLITEKFSLNRVVDQCLEIYTSIREKLGSRPE